MSRWDKFGAHNDRWGRSVKKDARPTWRIVASIGNALGAKLRFNTVEDVFKEMTEEVLAFRGLSYPNVGSRGVMANGADTVTMLHQTT